MTSDRAPIVNQLEQSLRGTLARPDPWPLCPACRTPIRPTRHRAIVTLDRDLADAHKREVKAAISQSRWGHFVVGYATAIAMGLLAYLSLGCF